MPDDPLLDPWARRYLEKKSRAEESSLRPLHDYLADIGVKPQLKFLEALEDVPIVPYEGTSTYPEGSYGATQEVLGRYPLGVGERSVRRGAEGTIEGAIEVSPDKGAIFLHEALHRLDDVLPKDKWWEMANAAMEYYGRTDPVKAYGLGQALYGENPELPAQEVFPRFLMDFLLNHEDWPAKMGKLVSPYFRFE